MSYLSTLDWFKDFERYDENTKKILMALSERQYKFRNLRTLHNLSGMQPYTTDAIIKNLANDGVVYVKTMESGSIVVGLRERQDVLPTAMLVYTIDGVVQDSFVIEHTKKNTELMFKDYIKKRLPVRVEDEHVDEIFKYGHYRWTENGVIHVVNVTNTKIVPA